MKLPASLSLGVLWLGAMPAVVHAHITMTSPAPRALDQKQGPCGITGSPRGEQVTVLRAGSVLRMAWTQRFNHPGHFRVSFDADGDDDFVDPITKDELYSNQAVLLDGIPSEGDGPFFVDVQLPDIECERCTIQLIQVMYDKPPYQIPGNDIYYQCADVVLRKEGCSRADGGGESCGADSGDGGLPPGSDPSQIPGRVASEGGQVTEGAAPPSQERAQASESACSATPARTGTGAWAFICVAAALGGLARRRRLPAVRADA